MPAVSRVPPQGLLGGGSEGILSLNYIVQLALFLRAEKRFYSKSGLPLSHLCGRKEVGRVPAAT